MAGTAVESVPGGLLDRLTSGSQGGTLTAVLTAAAGGDYRAAMGAVPAPGSSDAPRTAWYRYAWHGANLSFPDGTARLMTELGLTPLSLPARSGQPCYPAEPCLIGELLIELRDWRAMMSPHRQAIAAETGEPCRASAMATISQVRRELGDRHDLLGHLDLLAADISERAGNAPAADRFRRSAHQRLSSIGDRAGLAAAAVIEGDRLAAPLTTPLSWNCELTIEPNAAASELASKVESAEFDAGAANPAALTAAAAAYDEADRRYAALDDPGGLACVALRRGFLAVLSGRPDEAVRLAEQARSGFEAAGRPLDVAIAATHAALATVADDRLPDDAALAELICTAATRTIGHTPAVGLAVLCVRVGRHWGGKGQQPERGPRRAPARGPDLDRPRRTPDPVPDPARPRRCRVMGGRPRQRTSRVCRRAGRRCWAADRAGRSPRRPPNPPGHACRETVQPGNHRRRRARPGSRQTGAARVRATTAGGSVQVERSGPAASPSSW